MALAKGKRGRKADKEFSELKEKVEQLSKEIENIKNTKANAVEIKTEAITDSKEVVPTEVKDTRVLHTEKNYIETGTPKIMNYLKTHEWVNNSIVKEVCGVNQQKEKSKKWFEFWKKK